MRIAYGQVPLDKETAKHCNFQIIGGKATGTFRYITGFHGLTVMPTEFRKAMDKELSNIPNTNVFLDDILIVTNCNLEKHYNAIRQVLKKLNNATVKLKWENRKFDEIEWVQLKLGYKLTQTGIQPKKTKNRSHYR